MATRAIITEQALPVNGIDPYQYGKNGWFQGIYNRLRRNRINASKSTSKPINPVDIPGSDEQILDNKAW